MENETPGIESLDSRAARGIRALLVRQVFMQVFSVVGSVLLARRLGPTQLGLFATVNVSVTLISLVASFGLAPSFIQRRGNLTDDDLQVGFTVQQILTGCIVAILFAAAPWISRFYDRSGTDLTWLVRALAVSLVLASWRSMSALQLERHLHYARLAWIEVVEMVSYQVIAVGLAFTGAGTWSLIWAVLARGILGTCLMYAAAPWRIRLAFDRQRVRTIVATALPFQAQLIVNTGGLILPNLLAARMIGPEAIGYLGWAQNYGSKPLDVVQNVMRVSFAHFSRIQEEREKIEATLGRYLTFLLLASGVWLACIISSGSSLVGWIFTDEWSSAVPTLTLYAVALNFSVLSSVGAMSLNGIGLARRATRAMFLRTVVHIALSLVLVSRVGYKGVAMAWVVAAPIEGVMVYTGFGPGATRRILARISWLVMPLAAAAAVGRIAVPDSLPPAQRASIGVAVTLVTYAVVAAAVGPRWLRQSVLRALAAATHWRSRVLPRPSSHGEDER